MLHRLPKTALSLRALPRCIRVALARPHAHVDSTAVKADAAQVMSATKRNLQRNELYRFRVRGYWEERGWGDFCTTSSAVRCGDEDDDSVVGMQDTAAAVKAAVAQVCGILQNVTKPRSDRCGGSCMAVAG